MTQFDKALTTQNNFGKNITITVVPLMRDRKSHLKKWSLKRGLPYLVGNQEVTLVPDYPPNKANPS